MAKYRKKPVLVEAVQWFEDGDHPDVKMIPLDRFEHLSIEDRRCQRCQLVLDGIHGEVELFPGCWHKVCPGDFIVTGIPDGLSLWRPDHFLDVFEEVESENDD